MARLKKLVWPQNFTMVEPESHVVYGPCPYLIYRVDDYGREEDFPSWLDDEYGDYISREAKTPVKRRDPYWNFYGYAPYWFGWGYEPYTSYDSGQTDMSNETAGGNWSGADSGYFSDFGGGDFSGCDGSVKKHLKKKADTHNIHEVSHSDSIAVFQNLYDSLIEDGYELFPADEETGCWGCFGYQLAPLGVDEPIIYFLEIYQLRKGNKNVSVVVEHRYDVNGIIIDSSYQKFDDFWNRTKSNVNSGTYKLNDGNTFIPTDKTSYSDTKALVDEEIAKRNEQLIS